MSLVFNGKIAGIFLVFFIILIMQISAKRKAKEKAKEKGISVEEFKVLEQGSYEVYLFGVQSKLNELNQVMVENIKLVDKSVLKKILMVKSVEELPFDSNKELMVCFSSPSLLSSFDNAVRKFNLKYRILGEHKELVNEFKK